MNTSNILYYCLFKYVDNGKKTPKYTSQTEWGHYPEMNELRSRQNTISMYLMQRERKEAQTPPMFLQAKNSLNFTGLKDYSIDGKPSGFAYGYPMSTPVYGKGKRSNPFYKRRNDGYLFIFHYKERLLAPAYIELVILDNAKPLIAMYCKQASIGCFNDVLKEIRGAINASID